MAGGFSAIGEARAFASLVGLAGRFRAGLADASEMAGQILVRTTQEGMEGAGGGRFYPGQRRQSSAPGGYPAIQSSQLYGSLGHEVSANQLRFGSTGAFNGGFDYAIGQHEGTSKMGARPYLKLTVAKKQAEIANVLGEGVWRKIVGG
jgi:hypothetical protein